MRSFVLASKSPRRIQLLREAGYEFDILPSGVDESVFDLNRAPTAYAETLAEAKAEDIARHHPDRLVLGADTIVDYEGQIIGKPRDEAHAKCIVKKLFSRPHCVITGLALIWKHRDVKIVTHDSTRVIPRRMSPAQIEAHLQSETWQGKAGAYAIQENGDEFIEHLEGSLTNVIGLPMERLGDLLTKILSM
ncbi:MAG: septum formation protein Maf [Planctomycetes bacterium]|nr:septum formation protein Maf [Planctomycetota bacterium]